MSTTKKMSSGYVNLRGVARWSASADSILIGKFSFNLWIRNHS